MRSMPEVSVHGEMFGFVEVEELVFGERTTLVVDPSEEKIKSEFEDVKRTYLPMHAIIRIDEVDKQGVSKISKLEGGNVAQFPMPMYTPGGQRLDLLLQRVHIFQIASCIIPFFASDPSVTMLELPGQPALSDFRVANLTRQAKTRRWARRVATGLLRLFRCHKQQAV